MSALLAQLLGLVLLAAGLAFIAAWARDFRAWAAASGLAVLLWGLSAAPPGWLLAAMLALWGAPLLLWSWPGPWRRLVLRPAWKFARAGLPSLSDTERAALEAGVAGWERALFAGAADWRTLLEGAPAELSETEQAFLDGPVEALCALLDDWRISSSDHDLPAAAWELIRRERFFGLVLPEEYGGLGFSALAHSAVVMKLASRSVAAAVTVMVPNSLGPGKLLLAYGTEEQKARYLPRLAAGEETPCFGLTGPQAGSDAAAVPDTGVVCRREVDGEETLGVRLDFDKRYITLAPVATLIGLAFRLRDPDGLLGGEVDRGITLALVPADAPGVEIGRRHMPLQVPFMNGPVAGRGVFVPLAQVIGGAGGVGRGWRMLMECLGEGRAISLPALACAGAKFAARETGAYAALRRQFGRPIARFEGVQELLGRIGGEAWLMDAARLEAARLEDAGECSSVASAIVKQQLTERMRRTVNAAMDLHAGAGICVGPRNRLARLYQAVPIAITVEGSNVLTRNLIIFGQGLARCHPHLRREMECLERAAGDGEIPDDFDAALRAHLGGAARNAARAFLLGLSAGRCPVPGARGARERGLAWRAAAFATAVDALLLRYGGALKRRERLSARLADLLSAQYLAVCAERQHARENDPDDAPLYAWALAACRRDFDAALDGLLANLDGRALRWGLGLLLRPWGRRSRPGADALDAAAAELLTAPGPARDRLCAGLHLDADPDSPSARLERELAAAPALEAARAALRAASRAGRTAAGDDYAAAAAAGAISAEQAAALGAADARLAEIVAVDSFAAGAWRRAPVEADG